MGYLRVGGRVGRGEEGGKGGGLVKVGKVVGETKERTLRLDGSKPGAK